MTLFTAANFGLNSNSSNYDEASLELVAGKNMVRVNRFSERSFFMGL